MTKKPPNASRQKPKPPITTGNKPQRKQQTVMREEYAGTGDSGFGLLHAFVSH
jgi:hypothetical protein